MLLGQGEVIVVTAQKREERLIDVPLAVTAVSGTALENSFANNLETLPRLVPTLTFRKGNITSNSALFLRGMGTISFSIAAEPSVATVVDGVVYARSGQAFADMFDVERVEVLRGPQGTLFGKNASAGVLNITTRRPRNRFESEVTMSAFGGHEYRTRGTISGPIRDDLRGRFTAFYGNFDGHIDNVYLGEKVNGYSRQGVRGLLEWVPPIGELGLNFTLIADYGHGNDDCCAEVIGMGPEQTDIGRVVADALGEVGTQGPEGRTIDQNLKSRNQDETFGVSLQAGLETLKHVFTSVTAYREWSNTELRDGDFLSVGASHVGLYELHDRGNNQFRQLTQELRVMSPTGQRFEYQAGLFFFHLESDGTFTRNDITCSESTLEPDNTGIAPCLTGQSTIAFPSATAALGSELDNYAAFGQGLVRITDDLHLIGGLRWTRDQLSFYHSRTNESGESGPGVRPGNFPSMGGVYTDSTTESGVTGRSTVQYEVLDDVNAFASYARGYKGPAFNVFFNFSENDAQPIAAETSNAFEAGAKGALLGGKLFFSATGFYQQFDNYQANNFIELNNTIITTLTNAGTVSTKGFESELTARPIPALALSGSLAYVDAQIDEFKVVPGAPMTDDRSGERLPLSPDWRLSLGGDYRLPEKLLPWNVSIGSLYSWQSSQYSDLGENPNLRIDAYGSWDANLTIVTRDDRLSLTFMVKNILDEHFASLITPGAPGGWLRYQIPREADRFAGVSLRAKL